jgi:hypothetical protein
MGNPAGVKKMKREKRRAKFEQRLGAVAYVPKDMQDDVRKAVAEAEAAEAAAKKAHAAAKKKA